MEPIQIDTHICKGCGLCVEFCPRHILELSDDLNAVGYHPAQITDTPKCTSCALCAQMCPESAISVYRKRGKSHDQ